MLPIVLCNGAEPWTAKTDRADLIDPRLPPQLRHWQPQMRSGARGSHVELSFVVRPLFFSSPIFLLCYRGRKFEWEPWSVPGIAKLCLGTRGRQNQWNRPHDNFRI